RAEANRCGRCRKPRRLAGLSVVVLLPRVSAGPADRRPAGRPDRASASVAAAAGRASAVVRPAAAGRLAADWDSDSLSAPRLSRSPPEPGSTRAARHSFPEYRMEQKAATAHSRRIERDGGAHHGTLFAALAVRDSAADPGFDLGLRRPALTTDCGTAASAAVRY